MRAPSSRGLPEPQLHETGFPGTPHQPSEHPNPILHGLVVELAQVIYESRWRHKARWIYAHKGENMGVMGMNCLPSVSGLRAITVLGYPILAVLKAQRVTLVESA